MSHPLFVIKDFNGVRIIRGSTSRAHAERILAHYEARTGAKGWIESATWRTEMLVKKMEVEK